MKLKASSLKRLKKKKTFRQIHQEKEKAQINKTRNEKEEVTMNTTEISTTSNYMPIKWKI